VDLRDQIYEAQRDGDLILVKKLKQKLMRRKKNPSTKSIVIVASILLVGAGILVGTALYKRKRNRERLETKEPGDIL
jgi:hypothetical protein